MHALIAHRPECEIVKLPKYNLCTCDYQKRLDSAPLAIRDPAPNSSRPMVPNGTFREYIIKR